MSTPTPRRRPRFSNLPIGTRLGLGFSLLVLLTLLLSAVTYLGSAGATEAIVRTDESRVPTTLAAARAQANLLRMLASTRGYLAFGDPAFRASYAAESAEFEADLARLEQLSPNFSPANQGRLAELRSLYEAWRALPDQLFALRDDQLDREPAYRLLATEGTRLGGGVLIATRNLINAQKLQPATPENIEVLGDMASFQGSFAALFSSLRSYVTTRNSVFRREYEANLTLNDLAWENLSRQRARLSENQLATLDRIEQERAAFFALPEQMFSILRGDDWRLDLSLFRDQALPQGDAMIALLDEITRDEQAALRAELGQGRAGLDAANRQNLVGGLIAVALGIAMAIFFRRNIAGPITRLTAVAEQIRAGDLTAQARATTRDEIGTLAATFNRMTAQLRGTLTQVRFEKKRADDLLDVVIPIGVALSSERDFNRLLARLLGEARAFCDATAGALYLRTEDDQLQYVLIEDALRDERQGGPGQPIARPPVPLFTPDGAPNQRSVVAHVALSGRPLNLPNAYAAGQFDIPGPRDFDAETGYPSQLVLPLADSQGKVIGVLQLFDAQDAATRRVVPFDENLQRMMESFSSLAAAALEAYIRERSLRQEIRQLRIEIDEVKRQKQVSEIVDTDFFQGLQSKVQAIRSRRGRGASETPPPVAVGAESAPPPGEADDAGR